MKWKHSIAATKQVIAKIKIGFENNGWSEYQFGFRTDSLLIELNPITIALGDEIGLLSNFFQALMKRKSACF